MMVYRLSVAARSQVDDTEVVTGDQTARLPRQQPNEVAGNR